MLTPEQILRNDVKSSINTLVEGVEKKDWSVLARVLRSSNGLRKRMTARMLKETIETYHGDIVSYLDGIELEAEEPVSMEDANDEEKKEEKKEEKEKSQEQLAQEKAQKELERKQLVNAKKTPEVKVYVHLLTLMFLVDKNGKDEEAVKCATDLVNAMPNFNRRTMDQLSARVYFFYSLTHERVGRLSSIRNNLLSLHRSSCLQHNDFGQAALTVAILRNYLSYQLFNQADKFRRTCSFPESRSGNLFARYLFYIGRINAVQLHYSDAFTNLSQAIRKAPQNTALGFRTIAQKFLIIVQLLMGEIPERSDFFQSNMKEALAPYFQLTQAVRVGDLGKFEKVANDNKSVWEEDGVYSLIVRVRNNVIKTGLRKINLSYARISIKDICQKLGLGSEESAEHIIAKAIHDGVIDAVIDRQNKFVFSKANIDVYSTLQPNAAFHKRVQFCMDIHNDAVKALRFPPDAHKPKNKQEIPADEEVELSEEDLDEM